MSKGIFLHGLSGYTNRHCRCDICSAAARATSQARRNRIKAGRLPPPSHVHGTENGYINWLCRCEQCTDAHRLNQRQRRAKDSRRRTRLAATP